MIWSNPSQFRGNFVEILWNSGVLTEETVVKIFNSRASAYLQELHTVPMPLREN